MLRPQFYNRFPDHEWTPGEWNEYLVQEVYSATLRGTPFFPTWRGFEKGLDAAVVAQSVFQTLVEKAGPAPAAIAAAQPLLVVDVTEGPAATLFELDPDVYVAMQATFGSIPYRVHISKLFLDMDRPFLEHVAKVLTGASTEQLKGFGPAQFRKTAATATPPPSPTEKQVAGLVAARLRSLIYEMRGDAEAAADRNETKTADRLRAAVQIFDGMREEWTRKGL